MATASASAPSAPAPYADPNFPPNLNIAPLHLPGTSTEGDADAHAQAVAIGRYGIAGRVWEASAPLVEYLTPGSALEPPCSLFDDAVPGPRRVVELGSGQALASLYLAARLGERDTVVLTDLPNVMPLCQQSIDSWRAEGEGAGAKATVVAQPLAWGEDASHLDLFGPFTHILMCDLVYFPHLYPPLLHTLLALTEPKDGIPDGDTFGPEIIMAWKSRQLGLEESFFDSFGRYFQLNPVVGGTDWDDQAKIFLCRRWRITDEWRLPPMERVMAGAPGVVQGRSFGLVDNLFAALEW